MQSPSIVSALKSQSQTIFGTGATLKETRSVETQTFINEVQSVESQTVITDILTGITAIEMKASLEAMERNVVNMIQEMHDTGKSRNFKQIFLPPM